MTPEEKKTFDVLCSNGIYVSWVKKGKNDSNDKRYYFDFFIYYFDELIYKTEFLLEEDFFIKRGIKGYNDFSKIDKDWIDYLVRQYKELGVRNL